MFEISASNKWNMANYTLITEAAQGAGGRPKKEVLRNK